MRRNTALALSAVVVLGQLFRLSPLIDVVTAFAPADLHLSYPAAHITFAPLTLLADWLNGGSRAELGGFFVWAIIVYIAVRFATGPGASRWRRLLYGTAFALSLAAFSLWLVYLPRAIPRLVTATPDQVVFDIHTHSSASRDGRAGFGVAANARWHQRAGFHAAFLTDHNVYGDARQWRRERAADAVRLLDGEELSLRGLHVIVLGNTERINNEPWNDGWDSTLQLLRRLEGTGPYLVASLPEYYRYHWGTDIGAIVEAGIEGFEVWTTSPKGMEIPDSARRQVVERGRLERLGLFGATDMHGIGYTATVWNVALVDGWRTMDDSTLTAELIGRFRTGPAHAVVAMRRYLPQGKAGSLFAVPLGVLTAVRAASLPHAASLLAWIWLPMLAGFVRSRRPPR